MWQLGGKTREMMGMQVCKAIFVRSLGGGNYLHMASHFFTKTEKFKTDKKNEYELHVENCKYTKDATHICYIDIDTGAQIPFGTAVNVSYAPNILKRIHQVDHLEGAAKATLGGNTNLIMVILAAGLGITVGLLIGMNMGAIGSAVGIGGNATKTVHPIIGALIR